jgi:EEF1A lysine methyltransferase 1
MAKSNVCLIFCTGAVMKDLLVRLFGVKELEQFQPKHENNLGNEFRCYLNYSSDYLK